MKKLNGTLDFVAMVAIAVLTGIACSGTKVAVIGAILAALLFGCVAPSDPDPEYFRDAGGRHDAFVENDVTVRPDTFEAVDVAIGMDANVASDAAVDDATVGTDATEPDAGVDNDAAVGTDAGECIVIGNDDNCDGVDDDCNGIADDRFVGDNIICVGVAEQSFCQVHGRVLCREGEFYNLVSSESSNGGFSTDCIDPDRDGITEASCYEYSFDDALPLCGAGYHIGTMNGSALTCVPNMDADGDGYSGTSSDCDDYNPNVHPGMPEACNGIDDNCDGLDEFSDPAMASFLFYEDIDGDGYGHPMGRDAGCDITGALPVGFSRDNRDCNDTNIYIHPGAAEICDFVDNNCDGVVDEEGCSCAGQVLHVPQGCGTIQQAVDTATPVVGYAQLGPLTTVVISPGVYNEHVNIPMGVNLLITSAVFPTEDPATQVIVNGDTTSAFSIGENATVTLQAVTVKSDQEYANYGSATVFAEFSHIVVLESVTIHTKAIGLSANYTDGTRLENSRIIGDGSPDTIGAGLYHQNAPGRDNYGSRVYNSVFENLAKGIYRCSGSDNPDLSPDSSSTDSNTYLNTPIFFSYNNLCG